MMVTSRANPPLVEFTELALLSELQPEKETVQELPAKLHSGSGMMLCDGVAVPDDAAAIRIRRAIVHVEPIAITENLLIFF